MDRYTGNKIYEYISDNNLDYFFCTGNRWLILYGNSHCIPKLLILLSEVSDIDSDLKDVERKSANNAYTIAENLCLPFIFVRYTVGKEVVSVWESNTKEWNKITFDSLKELYSAYGIEGSESGRTEKRINSAPSSDYHCWQRDNLGNITVTDLDLVKIRNYQVQ